ncbi:MAG: hypothetical protein JNM18_13315 [Planctomycetaceae bacterium]|nr:hypothetical protein [Planctomycetaceae bacterium]
MKQSSPNPTHPNNAKWLKSAFAWHGTALPRCADRIVLATLYCGVIQAVFKFEFAKQYAEFFHSAGFDSFAHTILGSLIGFLLVVRMNGSNARYWEGRSHWGTIINTSRNLARAGAIYTDEGEDLAGLITGYAISLRNALRGSRDLSETTLFLPEPLLQVADSFGNQPTAIAAGMTQWVGRQVSLGKLNPEMTRHFEQLIAELVSAQGGCEKIQKTPLPFAYVSLIKLLILVYLVSLPLVICGRFGWFSPLIMAAVALGMFGMEETSVEIEDPFGFQPNCLDLEVLTLTITRDTAQLAAFKS